MAEPDASGVVAAERPVVEPSALMWSGGIAALALVALLIAGAATLASPAAGWAGALRNWLVVLNQVNAGVLGMDALDGARAVDVIALLLAGTSFLGLRSLLGRRGRVWSAIGAALPFAGIAVLAVTGLAGRSGLMGGGVILGSLMARRERFRLLGAGGLVANWLLLIADFSTTGTPAEAAADLVAFAYVILIVWFAWLAFRLLVPVRGRLVPVGTHEVAAGAGVRFNLEDASLALRIPIAMADSGSAVIYLGVSDASTRFIVDGESTDSDGFLEAYDDERPFEVQVEERGRLAKVEVRGAK